MKPQTAFVTHNHVFHFTHMNWTAVPSIRIQLSVGIYKNMGADAQTQNSDSSQDFRTRVTHKVENKCGELTE